MLIPRRLVAYWALLLLLVPLATACSDTSAAPKPIIITGLFNLSGDMRVYDTPAEMGVQLAVARQNAAGGIHGQTIQYIVKDTATEAAKITAATNEAIRDGAVALIGYNDPDSVLSAAPLAQKAGIPFLTVGATSPRLPRQVGDLTFLAAFGDNVQAAAGATFLHDTFKARHIYLLTNNGPDYTRGLSGYFADRWNSLEPGGIVLSDTYQIKDTDFSAQIGRLKALATPPDAIYLASYPDELLTLIPALRAAGFMQPILGGDGFDGAPILTLDGKPTSDVYFTTHGTLPGVVGTPLNDFTAAYNKKYGKDPDSIFAALGYDSARLLFDALSRAPDTSSAAIRTALESTKDFVGATGTMTYGPAPDGHVPNKSVTVMEIHAGQLRTAAAIRPETVPAP